MTRTKESRKEEDRMMRLPQDEEEEQQLPSSLQQQRRHRRGRSRWLDLPNNSFTDCSGSSHHWILMTQVQSPLLLPHSSKASSFNHDCDLVARLAQCTHVCALEAVLHEYFYSRMPETATAATMLGSDSVDFDSVDFDSDPLSLPSSSSSSSGTSPTTSLCYPPRPELTWLRCCRRDITTTATTTISASNTPTPLPPAADQPQTEEEAWDGWLDHTQSSRGATAIAGYPHSCNSSSRSRSFTGLLMTEEEESIMRRRMPQPPQEQQQQEKKKKDTTTTPKATLYVRVWQPRRRRLRSRGDPDTDDMGMIPTDTATATVADDVSSSHDDDTDNDDYDTDTDEARQSYPSSLGSTTHCLCHHHHSRPRSRTSTALPVYQHHHHHHHDHHPIERHGHHHRLEYLPPAFPSLPFGKSTGSSSSSSSYSCDCDNSGERTITRRKRRIMDVMDLRSSIDDPRVVRTTTPTTQGTVATITPTPEEDAANSNPTTIQSLSSIPVAVVPSAAQVFRFLTSLLSSQLTSNEEKINNSTTGTHYHHHHSPWLSYCRQSHHDDDCDRNNSNNNTITNEDGVEDSNDIDDDDDGPPDLVMLLIPLEYYNDDESRHHPANHNHNPSSAGAAVIHPSTLTPNKKKKKKVQKNSNSSFWNAWAKQLQDFRVADACPGWYLHVVMTLQNTPPPSTTSTVEAKAKKARESCRCFVYRRLPPRGCLSSLHWSTQEPVPVHLPGCLWEWYTTTTTIANTSNASSNAVTHDDNNNNHHHNETLDKEEDTVRVVGPPFLDALTEFPELHIVLDQISVIQEEARTIASWTAWPEQQHYGSVSSSSESSFEDSDNREQHEQEQEQEHEHEQEHGNQDLVPWTVVPLCYCFPATDVSQRTWIHNATTLQALPRTLEILHHPQLAARLRTALFSRLQPGALLFPHTGWADLANHVLRVHVPIQLPASCASVATSVCGVWVDGLVQLYTTTGRGSGSGTRRPALICFDDSKLHWAFNYDEQESRVVLILDFERPADLPPGTAVGGHTDELDRFILAQQQQNQQQQQ